MPQPATPAALRRRATTPCPQRPGADRSPPPSEEQAKAALEESPCHGEMSTSRFRAAPDQDLDRLSRAQGQGRRGHRHPSGLRADDWPRGVADELAKEGLIGSRPTCFRPRPNGGDGLVSSRDDVVELVREVSPADGDASGRRPRLGPQDPAATAGAPRSASAGAVARAPPTPFTSRRWPARSSLWRLAGSRARPPLKLRCWPLWRRQRGGWSRTSGPRRPR